MKSKQLLLSLTCAAMLGACASTKAPPPPPPAPPTMASLLSKADSEIKAGQPELAIATLKLATKNYPTDKTAWLRIAQVSFECHEYGDAITHAKKVRELDPDDVLAQSLLAVSGLRVTSKALADLKPRNKVMAGDVRAEAQNLAAILRTSIGGEIIPAPGKRDIKPYVIRTPAAPPVKSSASQGLLDILNQPNDPGKK